MVLCLLCVMICKMKYVNREKNVYNEVSNKYGAFFNIMLYQNPSSYENFQILKTNLAECFYDNSKYFVCSIHVCLVFLSRKYDLYC